LPVNKKINNVRFDIDDTSVPISISGTISNNQYTLQIPANPSSTNYVSIDDSNSNYLADGKNFHTYDENGNPFPLVFTYSFNNLNCSYAYFNSIELSGCDLSQSNFSSSQILFCSFKNVNLKGANFSNSVFNCPLAFSSSDASNSNIFDNVNFTSAKLGGTNLNDSSAKNAILISADFSYSSASGVDFTGTNFTSASLYNTNLNGVKMINTICTNVDFRLTDVRNVDFSGANLSNTKWDQANVDGAIMSSAILTGVISGSIYGTPLSLPPGWTFNGAFIPPPLS